MLEESLENKIVKFDVAKNMKCIKKLGQGGTGSTYLFLDESVDMQFAIKKYTPSNENDSDVCYKHFIDEIKILFKISHPNIVRIYNYYLFNEQKTGYIQMEYIEGNAINQIIPDEYDKNWNDYFIEAINAFDYLYEKGIMHRDIRPNNFMIDNETGMLKIIDFGFGKTVEDINTTNSIILNWPASKKPEEVEIFGDYNYSTEIYYIGELFKHLIKDDTTFLYTEILNKMLEYSPENRYKNYKEIKEDISSNLLTKISFNARDREVYSEFATGLYHAITEYTSEHDFITDIERIRALLEKIVRVSVLEKYVQNNNDLIRCFVNSGFRYSTRNIIKTEHLIDFYKLFVNASNMKKQIIIDNLIARLKSIPVKVNISFNDEDLPF